MGVHLNALPASSARFFVSGLGDGKGVCSRWSAQSSSYLPLSLFSGITISILPSNSRLLALQMLPPCA